MTAATVRPIRYTPLRPVRSYRLLVVALACLFIAGVIAFTAWVTDPTTDLPAQPYERTIP